MTPHLWVLVEGLPGIGKSTTSRRLAEVFQGRGKRVHCIAEGGESPEVGLPWSYAVAEDTVRRTHPETYPFSSWRAPAETDLTFVDARWLQNTALFEMLRGEPPNALCRIPAHILAQLDHACVVHLCVSDPRQHLRQSLASRRLSHPDWAAFVVPFFANQPFCVARGLEGDAAYIESLVEWDGVSRRLVDRVASTVHRSGDPAHDWERSLDRICESIEASYAAACASPASGAPSSSAPPPSTRSSEQDIKSP